MGTGVEAPSGPGGSTLVAELPSPGVNTPQPQPTTGAAPTTPPGAPGINGPNTDSAEAKFKEVFAKVDQLLQQNQSRLPAEAQAKIDLTPKQDFAQAHVTRVKNIDTMLKSLPAADAKALRAQLIDLGKEIGVNFGLRTGSGKDSPAVNSDVQLAKPFADFLKNLVEKVMPLFGNNSGDAPNPGGAPVTAAPGTPGAQPVASTPQSTGKPADFDRVQKLLAGLPPSPDPKLNGPQFKDAALARLDKILQAADRMGADGKPGQDQKLTKNEFLDFLKTFGASLPNDVQLLALLADQVFAKNPGPAEIKAIVDGLRNVDGNILKNMSQSVPQS
jgi:hypothetical protein